MTARGSSKYGECELSILTSVSGTVQYTETLPSVYTSSLQDCLDSSKHGEILNGHTSTVTVVLAIVLIEIYLMTVHLGSQLACIVPIMVIDGTCSYIYSNDSSEHHLTKGCD